MREVFSLFDVDSSGAISYRELRACMRALQIKVDKEELRSMVLEVDADQSGEIEFPEARATTGVHTHTRRPDETGPHPTLRAALGHARRPDPIACGAQCSAHRACARPCARPLAHSFCT